MSDGGGNNAHFSCEMQMGVEGLGGTRAGNESAVLQTPQTPCSINTIAKQLVRKNREIVLFADSHQIAQF